LISSIIAKRYAKALFAVAKEEGQVDIIGNALKSVGEFMAQSPEIEAALINPIYPMDLKRSIVEEIIKAYGLQGVLVTFLKLLVERHRIQCLAEIVTSFSELMDEESGVVKAIVKTAVPLSPELKEKFAEVLAGISSKKIILEVKEDPSIIGGVVTSIGDTVWDGSIRSQLQGFKESIERGELV
jgi:F-type H+-transporting ATPase subunit delta